MKFTNPLVSDILVIPKDEETKFLITTVAKELNTLTEATNNIALKALELASQFPEYPVVAKMYGVGNITSFQLIAEIGKISIAFLEKPFLLAMLD